MAHARDWLASILLHACVAGSLLLTGCAAAPLDYPRQPSTALAEPAETRLARQLRPQLAAHPGESGFYLLDSGAAALVSRLALIDAAEKTVDVQCFLMGDDVAGTLLIEHLFAAADRGARVRLLLDDWNQAGQDARFAAIAAHRNVEVRMFNPAGSPRWSLLTRPLEYGFGPARMRRRMHGKAMIIDNTAAVVGGRNNADEYFASGEDHNFGDLDLVVIGPLARAVSGSFDEFWNHRLAVPIEAFVDGRRTRRWVAAHQQRLLEHHTAAAYGEYASQLRASEVTARFASGQLPLIWAQAEFLHDSPQKVLQSIEQAPSAYMILRVQSLAREAQQEVLMMSPYLVPGEGGMQWFSEMRHRGVSMKVLTNSLASTDEISTYGGYERYRGRLLRLGVELYELRTKTDGQGATRPGVPQTPPDERPTRPGDPGHPVDRALHAKCLVLDREVVFIGSLNLDRRSARLDTEDGLVVKSRELADRVAQVFEKHTLPRHTYRLMLRSELSGTREPGLAWLSQEDGKPAVHHDNPGSNPWRRLRAWVFSWLAPEQWL